MQIVVASDHGGFHLKELIISYLQEEGHTVIDCGTHSTDSCDYPLIVKEATTMITEGKASLGILLCGTGIGVSMAANKVPGIRAALCHDVFSAKATRAHNDANVLTMGERVIGPGLALEVVKAFISGSFEGGRHERRVNQIKEMERSI